MTEPKQFFTFTDEGKPSVTITFPKDWEAGRFYAVYMDTPTSGRLFPLGVLGAWFDTNPADTMNDKKTLSMDDVEANISEIANDPEHRDHWKALKHLAIAKNSAITLSPPLTGQEIIERLARLMRGAGADACRQAYSRAFSHAKKAVTDAPKIEADDLPNEYKITIEKCKSLKHFYRFFPEVKRPGFPAGYPAGKGIEIQKEWCHRQARLILIGRMQQRAKETAAHHKAQDAEIRTEVAGG